MRLRQGAEFLRPCHQAVGLAEGVRRHGVARQVSLVSPGLKEQGTAAEQPTFLVAPGAGQHDLGFRRRQNGLEVPTIRRREWLRVELGRGNDVIGKKTVLGAAARPTGGVQAQKADKTPGRRRQLARRHPADRDARIELVYLSAGIQGAVQRRGRAGTQRLAPDGARPPAQKRFAGLLRAGNALVQQADDEVERGAMIHFVRPVGRRQTLNQPGPGFAGR